MSLTVTPLPNATPPSVEIIADPLTPGVPLLRNGEPVRVAASVPGPVTILDADAPFGVPLLYTLGTESAPAVTLSASRSWLTHPFEPSRSRPVTIENDNPITFGALGTVHRPLAGGTPFVIYGPRSGREAPLRLAVPWADRPAMISLLQDGAPLLLRTPPSCRVDDGWRWAGTITQERAVTSDIAWITLETIRVRAPEPTEAPATRPIRWADLPNLYATWGEIPAAFPTWADVPAATVPDGGLI